MWFGLVEQKMVMTASNVVCGRLKELDREDTRKRPGRIE